MPKSTPAPAGFAFRDHHGQLRERTPCEGALKPGSKELEDLARRVIADHNAGRPNRRIPPEDHRYEGAWTFMGPKPPAVLVFRSFDAALLWIEEALGQISDGKYEGRGKDDRDFWRLRVEVEPALLRSGVDRPWKPPFRVSFADLVELFDLSVVDRHPSGRDRATDVRAIYSQLPTRDLVAVLDDIAHAANGGRPERIFRLAHPDGRRSIIHARADRLSIDLTLSDGERIPRQRRSPDPMREASELAAEMRAEGWLDG